MTAFSTQRFERITFERTKGPSEKRRLQRRLEERRLKKGLSARPMAPIKPTPPKTSTTITEKDRQREQRALRAQRKFRRRIKTRQRLAARSGLPELDRRSKWRAAAKMRTSAQATYKGVDGGVPARCAGETRAAEEIIEVSRDTRQKTPLYDNFFEDLPQWR